MTRRFIHLLLTVRTLHAGCLHHLYAEPWSGYGDYYHPVVRRHLGPSGLSPNLDVLPKVKLSNTGAEKLPFAHAL